jgi:hypothetical protein
VWKGRIPLIGEAKKAGTTPANPAGETPRYSSAGLRYQLVLVLFASCAIAAGLWVRQDASRTRVALATAWSENRALKVRQEILLEELSEASGRLEALESGERTDPSRAPQEEGRNRGRGST